VREDGFGGRDVGGFAADEQQGLPGAHRLDTADDGRVDQADLRRFHHIGGKAENHLVEVPELC
jgi:hypothetical protein